MKIRTKVFLVTVIVTALLLSLSWFSLNNANQASISFSTYRENARATNILGRIQANILTTRIFADSFYIDSSVKNIQGVHQRASQTLLLIDEAQSTFDMPDVISQLKSAMHEYINNFERLVNLQQNFDQLGKKILLTSNKIIAGLNEVMISAYEDDDVQAAYWAAQVQLYTLRSQVTLENFALDESEQSYTTVSSQIESAHSAGDTLQLELDNPRRIALFAVIADSLKEYQADVSRLNDLLLQRQHLIRLMNQIGDELADFIEAKKLNTKKHQDTIGPLFDATILNTYQVTVVVVAIVSVIAALLIFFIHRSITKPLRRLRSKMLDIANGKIDNMLVSTGKDEISGLATVVETFRQRTVDLREAQEKLVQSNEDLDRQVAERTKELQAAVIEAENSNRAKSRFLANMSHELRTPMHAILNFSRLASRLVTDEQAAKYIDRIDTSAKRLRSLLDDLLDLSKLEAENVEIYRQSVDFNHLLGEVVEASLELADKKNQQIITPDVSEFLIEADIKLIRQVVSNLLSNAIEYTGDAGIIVVDFEYTTLNQQKAMRFSITDDGIGIPKDEIETIFGSFNQSTATRTNAGGTGLGLPICREIIQLHQGIIWADSPPPGADKGSRLTFVIPVRPSAKILPISQKQPNHGLDSQA